MISYQLKPCCNECNYLKLDYEQYERSLGITTIIYCEHQEVCGKYSEVKYHSEVE